MVRKILVRATDGPYELSGKAGSGRTNSGWLVSGASGHNDDSFIIAVYIISDEADENAATAQGIAVNVLRRLALVAPDVSRNWLAGK